MDHIPSRYTWYITRYKPDNKYKALKLEWRIIHAELILFLAFWNWTWFLPFSGEGVG